MIKVESLMKRGISNVSRRPRASYSLVRFFGKGVKLGNGIIECLLGEVTGSVGAVENFVVEYREVQGQTESDGVGRGKLGNGNVRGSLVGFQRLVSRLLSLVTSGELGEVSVVVSHPLGCWVSFALQRSQRKSSHLVVEDLGFTSGSRGNQVLVQNAQDVFTDLGQLGLDLLSVTLDHGDLGIVTL